MIVPKGTKVCKGKKVWREGEDCPHLEEKPKEAKPASKPKKESK